MLSPQFNFEVTNPVQTLTISHVNEPRISINSQTQEVSSFNTSLVKKIGIAGMFVISSMSSAGALSESHVQPFIEIEYEDLKKEIQNQLDFTQTGIIHSFNSNLLVMNKTIESLEPIEELGLGGVDRVEFDYHPKVKKVAKPVKVTRLNYSSAFENIREIH